VEWDVVSLESYYKSPIRDFGSFSSTKLITFLDEGIPFIKSEMIEEFYINWESVSYISNDVHKLLIKSHVHKGNILFSKIGSALGKAAIYDCNCDNCNSNAAVAKIDIDQSIASNDYVCIFLNSFVAKNQFSFMIISLLPRINLGDINKLLIFKMPLEEQNIIIKNINKIQDVIDDNISLISKLNLQKSGLMYDLLSGKVRVNNSEEQKEVIPSVNLTPLKTQVHNQHIEDAVLIAAIVNLFYSDKYPLDRKKVQKLLYLIRRHHEASVDCFKKKAAGPYADEIRYKGGEPIAIANKYIITKSSKFDKGTATLFSKGEKIANALEYIGKWNLQPDIDWLFAQFKWTKVDELELIATVDMARCDLEKDGIPVSLSTIKNLIATNKEWKEKLKKSYFDDLSIQRGINESYRLFGEYK
jgi:type I restriction enzyme S subunit